MKERVGDLISNRVVTYSIIPKFIKGLDDDDSNLKWVTMLCRYKDQCQPEILRKHCWKWGIIVEVAQECYWYKKYRRFVKDFKKILIINK